VCLCLKGGIETIAGIIKSAKRFSFFLFLSLLLIPSFASADRGVIIFSPSPTIRIDETGQNAIVAWNGNEEVIILSTNVRSSAEIPAIEILPLPSNPSKVTSGDAESFGKIAKLLKEKDEFLKQWIRRARGFGAGFGLGDGDRSDAESPSIEITLHQKIGSHDITVVKINDLDYFLDWVKNFTSSKGFGEGVISQEFRNTVSSYLQRDIRYFVFDVIEANTTQQTINPIIYRFDTSFLYYPQEITAASSVADSYADVNVFLVAKGLISEDRIRESNLQVGYYNGLEFSLGELNQVSPEVASLFNSNVYVTHSYHSGFLNDLTKDLVVYSKDVYSPTISGQINQGFSLSLILLFLTDMIFSVMGTSFVMAFLSLLLLVSIMIGIQASVFLMSRLLKRLHESTGGNVSFLLLIPIAGVFLLGFPSFPTYTMTLFLFIFVAPFAAFLILQLNGKKWFQLHQLPSLIVIFLLLLPQPVIGLTMSFLLLAIIALIGFLTMIKPVIGTTPTTVEKSYSELELYGQLLMAYTQFYGARSTQVLEDKLGLIMKKGLSREKAIRELAEKEKLI